jgi:hypothetical protein
VCECVRGIGHCQREIVINICCGLVVVVFVVVKVSVIVSGGGLCVGG